MKLLRTASALTAALLLTVPMNVLAADKAEPVFPEFNKNEVNGTLTVSLAEGLSAEVNITFDSPEWPDEAYYSQELSAGASCGFDIEGRDNTADDYRYYKLSVVVKDESTGRSSAAFTAVVNGPEAGSLMIPDVNDNPDSFVSHEYSFSADYEESENKWDVLSDDKDKTIVVFHLEKRMRGDVNGDGFISGVDATMVLSEYADLSAEKDGSFTDIQNSVGDINKNGKIDGTDATMILGYYADLSSGIEAKWFDEVTE